MSHGPIPSACQTYAPLLEALLDGELSDAREAADVKRHLQGCSDCRAEFETLKSLRQALAGLPVPSAPAGLRESISGRLVPAGYRSPRQDRMIRAMNHPALALTAAILAGLLIGTVWQVYANYRATSDLWPLRTAAAPVLDEHISLVLSDDGSSLQTGDPKALEEWFRTRLDFAPPVPSWPWAELVGGRLCLIGGERVARMEYAAGERQFTLFVQFIGPDIPGALRKCDRGGRAIISQQRGYKAAYWSRDGFSYVLVAHQTAEPVFQHLKSER